MADNPLLPYTPSGSNMQYPTSTERGSMHRISIEAVKDISVMDIPFWLKLRQGDCQAQLEQSELVDTFAPITTVATAIGVGAEPGDPATTINEQGAETKTSSNTNNRSLNKNFIQKIEDTFSITEEAEKIANMGGVAGGITSELLRDIKRKTDYMMKKVEFTNLSYQAGVRDLGDNSTKGKLAGAFKLLSTIPTNWADSTLGITSNINAIYDANGNKTTITPSALTEVTEQNMHDQLQICWQAGSSMKLDLYCPPNYHRWISDNYKGRPNLRVTVPESDKQLNMEFEVYTAVSGLKMSIIPHRNMTRYGMLLADHEQWAKRIFFPFEVRRYMEKTRNKRGYMQMAWTITPGVILASGGFMVTASMPS